MREGKRESIRRGAVEASLRSSYFANCPEGYLDTACGRNDLENQLWRRLKDDRARIAPWLDTLRPLQGASVLEIGCGTGSSTVALAELGASVIGVDVDPDAISVARVRCAAYDVTAELIVANAADLPPSLRGRAFDFIIFYASLEHMVTEERLAAMEATWRMLPEGALWCVVETPNRLWYFDWHTSQMPFFLWLPDELAFRYSRFSQRPRFGDLYREQTPEAMLHFLRRGRGVSFHEFEIVMGPGVHERVAGWLPEKLAADAKYVRLLRRAAPSVHAAFLGPRLDLAIRK